MEEWGERKTEDSAERILQHRRPGHMDPTYIPIGSDLLEVTNPEGE